MIESIIVIKTFINKNISQYIKYLNEQVSELIIILFYLLMKDKIYKVNNNEKKIFFNYLPIIINHVLTSPKVN